MEELKRLNKKREMSNSIQTAYWSVVGVVGAAIVSLSPVLAAGTIWDRAKTMISDVYTQILGISTIVAVLMAAIALVIRMVSRNQRAVDEATQWLKRIVITWIILNSLGLIVTYGEKLTNGGQYAV